jgi:hypothetical protein
MLAADLDRTPLQLVSIDMDLASRGHLSPIRKPRHRILGYVVNRALFSYPSYAILNGSAMKLLSLTGKRRTKGRVA